VIEPPQGLTALGGVVGVGIDLVSVARMATALERTSGFSARYFSDGEREVCDSRHDPAASYAARFAAKEAVLKALGLGIFELPLREIELLGGGDAAPALRLVGSAEERASRHGVGGWLVSISHDGGLAAAVAVALAR
jgi:holo-[acyl-carrier protein] synthase